jgi:DNA polymerase (family 10)
MTRADVVALLEEYATLLDLINEDEFRAKAFANAARQLDTVSATLDELMVGDRLSKVRGVGASVAQAIREAAVRGTFEDLESARARVPSGVLDLMRVEGLGPKKARTLWKEANVASLEELEAAIDAGSLTKLSGFGGKTVEKFRASLEFIKKTGSRRLRHHVKAIASDIEESLRLIPGVLSVHFCGSLRRCIETIGDLDCIVCAEPSQHESVKRSILALGVVEWNSTDDLIWSGKHATGIEIELSVCSPEELGTRLVLATGSKAHVAELQSRGKIPICASEEEVYRSLDLLIVPPALREENLTMRTSEDSPYLAAVTYRDLRGILHVHTTYSDGQHTLRQMAEAMIARGFQFLGIADHSKVAAYANGLTPERVMQQWEEIDYLNDELAPFRILKGTECDILPDGSLDFDDKLLAGFDFVVASIHSSFGMTEEQATDRLCRALENPHVDILGHPTGRLLLKREGYPVNHERLLECAAKFGKSIELNCNPHRFDLDWRWFARALDLKIPIPLNPDAHAIEGLDDIEYGLELAAKGPIPKELCPSAWTAQEFLNWCYSHDK